MTVLYQNNYIFETELREIANFWYMEKLQNTFIGAGGIGLVEAVPDIIPTSLSDTPGIVQTIIQILIGIVTLTGLLKRKRKQ